MDGWMDGRRSAKTDVTSLEIPKAIFFHRKTPGKDKKKELRNRRKKLRDCTAPADKDSSLHWQFFCILSKHLQRAGILIVSLKQRALLALKDAGEMFPQSN